jgi:hypothetical protein
LLWRLGGLALGLVFLAVVVLVKPIGVSTMLLFVGLVLGIVFIAVAFLLPGSLRRREIAGQGAKGRQAHP